MEASEGRSCKRWKSSSTCWNKNRTWICRRTPTAHSWSRCPKATLGNKRVYPLDHVVSLQLYGKASLLHQTMKLKSRTPVRMIGQIRRPKCRPFGDLDHYLLICRGRWIRTSIELNVGSSRYCLLNDDPVYDLKFRSQFCAG